MFFPGFEQGRKAVSGAEINYRIGNRRNAPPLLLLHGYPETHVMWHEVAPRLAEQFTVIVPDLRGYGDSSKPQSDSDHFAYSKRAMARDMAELMTALGHERFMVAGHDRGGRVTHRMCLDHGERISKAAVLDIVPTHKLYSETDKAFATAYYHWFFLIQEGGMPERLIGNDPEYYLLHLMNKWGKLTDRYAPEALAEYIRCFKDPATIHATCEDYRAGAGIDLVHDEADMDKKIACPLLVLWGVRGVMEKTHDVLAAWRERAVDVRGRGLDCGHFLPEERPDETYGELLDFFSS